MHLCRVYLDVSQNPILGINQTSDHFWSRIKNEYNSNLLESVTEARGKRSLQSRWQTIKTAVSKLRECVRQVENLNPSGASEQDIVSISCFNLCKYLSFY